jgi:hypothetical protein
VVSRYSRGLQLPPASEEAIENVWSVAYLATPRGTLNNSGIRKCRRHSPTSLASLTPWLFELHKTPEDISQTSQHRRTSKVPVVSRYSRGPQLPPASEEAIGNVWSVAYLATPRGTLNNSDIRKCRRHSPTSLASLTPWLFELCKTPEGIPQTSQHRRTSKVPVVSRYSQGLRIPPPPRRQLEMSGLSRTWRRRGGL